MDSATYRGILSAVLSQVLLGDEQVVLITLGLLRGHAYDALPGADQLALDMQRLLVRIARQVDADVPLLGKAARLAAIVAVGTAGPTSRAPAASTAASAATAAAATAPARPSSSTARTATAAPVVAASASAAAAATGTATGAAGAASPAIAVRPGAGANTGPAAGAAGGALIRLNRRAHSAGEEAVRGAVAGTVAAAAAAAATGSQLPLLEGRLVAGAAVRGRHRRRAGARLAANNVLRGENAFGHGSQSHRNAANFCGNEEK